jgi:hypothetical protein
MENHQEDILKKFLQDTFSDYEPEPTEQSWENIFSAIQPNKPTFWGKSKPWIASVLVILTSIGIWHSSVKVEANTLESGRMGTFATNENLLVKTPIKTESRRQSDDSQTDKTTQLENSQTRVSDDSQTEKIHQLYNKLTIPSDYRLTNRAGQSDDSQTDRTTQLNNSQTTVSDDSQTEKIHQLYNKLTIPSDYRLTDRAGQSDDSQTDRITTVSDDSQTEKKTQLGGKKIIQIAINQAITNNSQSILEPEKETKTAKYFKEIIVKNNTPKEEGENHPTVEKQSDEVVISRENFTASTSGRVESLATGKIDLYPNSNIEKVRYILPIESIKNKDVVLPKIEVNTPSILPIIPPTREAKPIRQHTYLSLSITPLQTYRILTINNRDVQNVQTNNLFDSERNGWQFEAGLVKPIGRLWNLRTGISYLKMRQWSEYQINTDELVLRNTNTAQRINTLEALGQTITESKTLQMVGLKADVQRFFKISGRNRYFISTGTQLMYQTNEKQTNIFINASAGFQHVVNKDLFLTIEPTASYLLYNINDSKSLIQTNAYNLGLKIGVNFKVK